MRVGELIRRSEKVGRRLPYMATMSDEAREHRQSERDAVPPEGREAVRLDPPEQPLHDEERCDGRHERAQRQHRVPHAAPFCELKGRSGRLSWILSCAAETVK